MIATKEQQVKIIQEEIVEIKCDCCKRKIVKNKDQDDDECAYASLIFYKTTMECIKVQDFEEPKECEYTDICEQCYKKIISFIKNSGGKAPSRYITNNESF